MRTTLMVHILAGTLAIVFGYVALYSAKGGALHRRSGMLFVYAMLTMATLGMLLAIVRDKVPAVNIPAGLLTATLVLTALGTMRPATATPRWLAVGAVLVFFGVGAATLVLGIEAVANGGKRQGIPAFPFFMFATAGVLAGVGDLQVLRSGPRRGTARLARHLWRMCFALLVASLSLGQLLKFVPKPFRIPALLMVPVLAVVATMLWWLWRVRGRPVLRRVAA